jgi:hypothetical protein
MKAPWTPLTKREGVYGIGGQPGRYRPLGSSGAWERITAEQPMDEVGESHDTGDE